MKKELIVWAVDALVPDRALRNRTVAALKEATRGGRAAILPVYVHNPVIPLVGAALREPDPSETRALARRALRRYLEGVSLPGLGKPVVVEAPNGSLRGRARALLKEARRRKASLIVVSTFSRKGLVRFLMGSFSETLLAMADRPLLVVNPTTRRKTGPILFATDFGKTASAALPAAIRAAKRGKSSLLLFHHLPPILEYVVDPLTNTTVYRSRTRQDRAPLEARARAECERIRAHGVKADYLFSDKGGSTAESLLLAARKTGARLVVMATGKGSLEAGLMGSTCRQVARHSETPVWLLHP